ncbi:MAG: ribosome silencing factor [Myxococcota bacterium]
MATAIGESGTSKGKPRGSKKAAATSKTSADPSLVLAHRVAELMLERKADNVTILHVGGLTSFADYFVLGTAQSDRQVQAMSRHLSELLKKEGHPVLSMEGVELSHWVLMDFGGVVAHIFYEPAREYYDLDGLWADAPRVAVEDTKAERAASKRKTAAKKG